MKRPTQRRRLTARTADRHDLYQRSVQGPEAECRLFDRLYRQKHGHHPRLLREDFCGTAYLSSTWVSKRRINRALGVDIDGSTLDWGREHNLARLGPAADRVLLRQADVRKVLTPKTQITCALNFSYFTFKSRETLRGYFRQVRRGLEPGGLFILDVFGGPEAQTEQDERRRFRGYVYNWRQESFDPVTHTVCYHIDFEFPDGSRIRPAFTYHWRLWTIPELRELLEEAGFASSHVYWEGTERATGDGNGVFRRVEKAPADASWVSYIVAHR